MSPNQAAAGQGDQERQRTDQHEGEQGEDVAAEADLTEEGERDRGPEDQYRGELQEFGQKLAELVECLLELRAYGYDRDTGGKGREKQVGVGYQGGCQHEYASGEGVERLVAGGGFEPCV